MEIFKAYDIRGRYPIELDEDIAERIGFAMGKFIGRGKIALGHDVRRSAPSITEAVARGISLAGVDVELLGLITTPMLYWAVGRLGYPGGVMVTASHNPPEWIGMKLTREDAIPIGEKSGLEEIQRFSKDPIKPSSRRGKILSFDMRSLYRDYILGFIKDFPPRRIVVDGANGSVGPIFEHIFRDTKLRWIALCFEPDGNFPNHQPDPLKDKNIQDLVGKVRELSADLGVAFDGDGDRIMFIDETGRRIPSDLITVLLAREVLKIHPGEPIIYDLRSSRVVCEEIEKLGGVPLRERVGHAFILGGELSGHYYFREHFFADSGLVAFAKMINYLAGEEKPVSKLVLPLRRYIPTGEINFRIEDKDAKIREVAEAFKDGKVDRLDGVSVEFERWWFNLRKSNTEPLLRLNMEAVDEETFLEAKRRLFDLLGKPITD
jgi:phosphomannomutase